jgi:hypothetical protein
MCAELDNAHLDLGNDLFLGSINIPRVHNAYDIRLGVLDMGDSCPQDSLSATARVAAKLRRVRKIGGHGEAGS